MQETYAGKGAAESVRELISGYLISAPLHRDKRRLENFIEDEIDYILDCYDAAAFLIADAELSILEVADAWQEYEERFGVEAEE